MTDRTDMTDMTDITHMTHMTENRLWRNVFFVLTGSSGKVKCEPNWSWQPAPLSDYDVWYAVTGQGRIWINEQPYEIKPGAFFLFQPGDRIRAIHDPKEPLTVMYCHFAPEEQNEQRKQAEQRVQTEQAEQRVQRSEMPQGEARCVYMQDTYRIEALLQQLIELASWRRAHEDEEFDLVLKLILMRREKERRQQQDSAHALHALHEQLVQRVRNEIRIRLSEPMMYREVAEAVQLSPRYLSHILKRYTGITLKETITMLRMERAAHLLNETSMSVSQIAEALAYSDIYTFSKLFKRYYGVSPTSLRKKG